MRYPLVFITFYMTACAMAENMAEHCTDNMGCTNVFGSKNSEQDKRIDELEDRMSSVESQVSSLETENDGLLASINILTDSVTDLSMDLAVINSIIPTLALASDVTALQAQASNMEARLTALESQIGTPVTGLQSIVVQNTIEILQLQQNHNVTKIVDPCGDGPGFDEVFMRTSSGKLIASFSQTASGLNTRFSILTPGTYSTTDGTGCTFTVNADMSVTPSVEY